MVKATVPGIYPAVPTDFGNLIDWCGRHLAYVDSFAQRLNGHIYTDLVAEPKVVGHGLSDAEHANMLTIHRVRLDAAGHSPAGEPDNLKCGIVEFGLGRAFWQGDVKIVRNFGCQVVKVMGRDQAHPVNDLQAMRMNRLRVVLAIQIRAPADRVIYRSSDN